MKKPLVIKLLSAPVNILVSVIGAVAALFIQNWFGSGDLYSYVFWAIPLSAGLSASGRSILHMFKPVHLLARLLFIFFISCLASFVYILLVYLSLGPWINAFSIPILYMWIAGSFAQLCFLDRLLPHSTEKSEPLKTVLGLLSFPLTAIIAILALYAISYLTAYLTRPEAETFLIPENFEGKIRIVYGEACGIAPAHENGRRVLEIPADGLLIIQPDLESGIIDHEYYFVNASGNRERLEEHYDPRDTQRGVTSGGSGNMTTAAPGSPGGSISIYYSDFYVYNGFSPPLADSAYNAFETRMDSLTTAMVGDCRKNKTGQ